MTRTPQMESATTVENQFVRATVTSIVTSVKMGCPVFTDVPQIQTSAAIAVNMLKSVIANRADITIDYGDAWAIDPQEV